MRGRRENMAEAPVVIGGDHGVSLCMIVRDEAANIAACLAAVEGLFPDIVVVDTGSTDSTREIARAKGARVYEFPWCDDFAAARNESIRHARGAWIFWLDADDRVPPESREPLRALLASVSTSTENAAYLMPVLSLARDGGPMSETVHVRLFRNLPGVRWEYRAHEQIAPSARRAGANLRPAEIPILHVGYRVSTVGDAKLARNLRLMDLDAESRPFDSFLQYMRAMTLMDLGRTTEALVAAQFCRGFTSDPSIHAAMSMLEARAYAKDGDLTKAIDAVRAGRIDAPTDVKIALYEAELHAALGAYGEAEARLRELLEPRPDHFALGPADKLLTRVRARFVLAEVLLAQGRFADAAGEARAVIANRPAFGPVWFTLGDALLGLGDVAALRELRRGLDAMPGSGAAKIVLDAKLDVFEGRATVALDRIDSAPEEHRLTSFVLRARAEILRLDPPRSGQLEEAVTALLNADPVCLRAHALRRALAATAPKPYRTVEENPLFALGPSVRRD